MKYIVILADGMADEPLEALGGRTPMEAACKPHMDKLACEGIMGMAQTVPLGMPPARTPPICPSWALTPEPTIPAVLLWRRWPWVSS